MSKVYKAIYRTKLIERQSESIKTCGININLNIDIYIVLYTFNI